MRKCREGRLIYPGPLSFLFIAIPMTLILFNETIGDTIIDTIIPSLYSGIMILGSTLYAISLATLLLPFCIITGVILYIIFVYFPSQRAHRLREEILHRCDAQAVTHSKTRYTNNSDRKSSSSSYFGKLGGYFRKLYRNLKYSIQNTVTYTSFYYILEERRKRRSEITQWRDMNMVLPLQGFVQSEKKNGRDVSEQSSDVDSSNPSPAFVPPKVIVDMMIPTTSWKRRRSSNYPPPAPPAPSTPNDKEANKTNVVPKFTKSVAVKKNVKNERIIIKKSGQKAHVKPSTALCDAKKAMKSMRNKLHPTACDEEHEKYLDVPVLDLLDEFEDLMKVFAPDGILMTEIERLEAVDAFNDWKESEVLRVKVKRVGDAVVYTQMINFHHFEKWFTTNFMRTMHGIVVDRFVDHTLRFGPYFKMRVIGPRPPPDVIPAAAAPDETILNRNNISLYISNEVSI